MRCSQSCPISLITDVVSACACVLLLLMLVGYCCSQYATIVVRTRESDRVMCATEQSSAVFNLSSKNSLVNLLVHSRHLMNGGVSSNDARGHCITIPDIGT